MRAVQWRRLGDPAEVAEVVDLPAPPFPLAGEVQLAPLYAPVNPADLLRMQGNYGNTVEELPAIAGGEGIARVLAVGLGVTHIVAGDLVLIPLGRGCWRTVLNVPAAGLFALQGGDPQQLAMLGINAPTAWRLLHDVVQLQAGDWIVQNAAGSAVGRMVIQLARRMGVRTLNIVRRPEQVSELLALGADKVYAEGPTLAERVGSELREPIRLAIDAVAGPASGILAGMLAEGGTLVTYGLLSGEPCQVNARDMVFRDIRFQGFWLARYRNFEPEASKQITAQLLQWISLGVLRTPIAAVYELVDVCAALRHAQQRGRDGKVLLRIGNDPFAASGATF